MELEQLKEEIKRRYPIGCTVSCIEVNSDTNQIPHYNFDDDELPTYWQIYDDEDIVELHTQTSYIALYNGSNWAEIVSFLNY